MRPSVCICAALNPLSELSSSNASYISVNNTPSIQNLSWSNVVEAKSDLSAWRVCSTPKKWMTPYLWPEDCKTAVYVMDFEEIVGNKNSGKSVQFRSPGASRKHHFKNAWTPRKYTFSKGRFSPLNYVKARICKCEEAKLTLSHRNVHHRDSDGRLLCQQARGASWRR